MTDKIGGLPPFGRANDGGLPCPVVGFEPEWRDLVREFGPGDQGIRGLTLQLPVEFGFEYLRQDFFSLNIWISTNHTLALRFEANPI